MRKHIRYLRYVLIHKWHVFWACLQLGVPIWRALLHDWTKFLPREWFPYVDYFYGDKRPDVGTEGYNHQLHQDDEEFNVAWNHHQKRNDHHWQYWMLNYDDGRTLLLPMPDVCKREMLADWIGAGKAQGKPNLAAWYAKTKADRKLHPETLEYVDDFVENWRRNYEQNERVKTLLGL